jgi:hypothetical protein
MIARVEVTIDDSTLATGRALVKNAFSAARSLKNEQLRQATLASRTPPWLPSGWGCRGRRLSRGGRLSQKDFSLPYRTLVPVQPVQNFLNHEIVGWYMSCFKHHVTLVSRRRTEQEKHRFL